MRKKFHKATKCGKPSRRKVGKHTRCVAICSNGQWSFRKNSACR